MHALAMISLKSYTQYSIAKKKAVKKAFQDRQDSFIVEKIQKLCRVALYWKLTRT